MRSKDLQKFVLSKYQNGDSLIRHLNGAIGLRTIERWCKILRKIGSIDLSKLSGRPRVIRTKRMIQKAKNRLKRKN